MKSVKYNSDKHKIKSEDDVKFPHNLTQRAFSDLNMSSYSLDGLETEIGNYDYCRNQNKIHGRITMEQNDK